MYAPELVVFTARRQWSSAKLLNKLVDEWGQARKQPHDDGNEGMTLPDRRIYEWTMTYPFLASTGGFAFDTADDEPQYLPTSYKGLTLTARGVALLASCDHLPSVSEAEITDKSKANNVAKALIIIQASWMLLQVTGRLFAALPVTLLEVNTIAHVMCAFLLYNMRWNKLWPLKNRFY